MTTTIDMPIALTGGIVYLLMALTMLRMLGSIPQARVVRLWVAGAAGIGVSLALVASRGLLPRFMGFEVVAVVIVLALLVQTAALRQLLALPRAMPVVMAAVAASLLVCTGLSLADERRALFATAMLTLAAVTGLVTWHARLTALRLRSGSAAMMAWSHGLLALAMLARSASVAAGVAPFQHGNGGITFLVLHAVVVVTALYSSLGFMGLMLDITRRAEAQAREAQVAEAARRETAEHTAQDLRTLLAQRDALSAERERLLQMLAHEIRQPLHNASGALQSAGHALQQQQPADARAVAQRLGRAEVVLGEVRSVLDNTLAAATLLSRSAPLAVQEVELDFLIDLALGDLNVLQRRQVQVQWHTSLRQVEVEPGLLRLALRNLLGNAFSHGGPGVQVQLQVAEQAEPPALLLRVVDDGPGLPGLAPQPGESDGRTGLGLQIVRQVMALHGGRLDLVTQAPRGLAAVLLLPLPAD